MLENLSSFPTASSCRKSPPSVRPQWGWLPRLGLGLWGLQKQSGHLGMSIALGMKASQHMAGQWEQKKQLYCVLSHHPHLTTQLQLEALVPWLEWLEWLWASRVKFWSALILSHRPQSRTSNCVFWLYLSTLAHSSHTHFCPSVLLARVWEEQPPKLPVGSQCTAGYFHKENLSNPIVWRSWWKSLS